MLNTHMVFDSRAGSERRRMQREALAHLVGVLLGLPPETLVAAEAADALCDAPYGIHSVPASSRVCRAVLVTGDFNHALRSQCTRGGAGSPPSGPSPSVYSGCPWLPKDCALDYLVDALKQKGAAEVRTCTLMHPGSSVASKHSPYQSLRAPTPRVPLSERPAG